MLSNNYVYMVIQRGWAVLYPMPSSTSSGETGKAIADLNTNYVDIFSCMSQTTTKYYCVTANLLQLNIDWFYFWKLWMSPSRAVALAHSSAWGFSKPKPSQARPKPGLSGRAGPAHHYSSLVSGNVIHQQTSDVCGCLWVLVQNCTTMSFSVQFCTILYRPVKACHEISSLLMLEKVWVKVRWVWRFEGSYLFVTDGQHHDWSSPFLSRLSPLPTSLSNNHMPCCYFTLTVRT